MADWKWWIQSCSLCGQREGLEKQRSVLACFNSLKPVVKEMLRGRRFFCDECRWMSHNSETTLLRTVYNSGGITSVR